jgi:hypothetical protein
MNKTIDIPKSRLTSLQKEALLESFINPLKPEILKPWYWHNDSKYIISEEKWTIIVKEEDIVIVPKNDETYNRIKEYLNYIGVENK